MKKILITGANSYIGTSFEEYIKKEAFDRVYLKQTPAIFQKKNADLLDYFLYLNN